MDAIDKSEKTISKAERQVDAIFALEGFFPDDLAVQLRHARAEGKIISGARGKELLDYAEKHQSLDGFAESRVWLK